MSRDVSIVGLPLRLHQRLLPSAARCLRVCACSLRAFLRVSRYVREMPSVQLQELRAPLACVVIVSLGREQSLQQTCAVGMCCDCESSFMLGVLLQALLSSETRQGTRPRGTGIVSTTGASRSLAPAWSLARGCSPRESLSLNPPKQTCA